MYFALRQDVSNNEAYKNFLSDIIEHQNKHYKAIFSEIIEQAQKLSQTQDYYSIDSERFGIISFFAQFNEVIKEMDARRLKKADFQKLLECFQQECHCSA